MSGGVAVIGAGWAGLAAAVELAAAGVPVSVFESTRSAGGRARTVPGGALPTDNGQHLLLGAYSETLRIMRRVGADPERFFQRQPLHLQFDDGFTLRLPRLPAPWHLMAGLMAARGLDWRERLAAATMVRRLARRGYRLSADTSVTQLLDRHTQPAALRRWLWEPLCLAALNTPPRAASAQVFCHVLRDTLGGRRDASDLLLARGGLGAAFPEPAARYLARRGGEVRLGTPIRDIVPTEGGYTLTGDPQARTWAQVIIATGPWAVPQLLHPWPLLADLSHRMAGWRHLPIATLYAAWADAPPLPAPMIGFTDAPFQWVFDLGPLPDGARLFAAVTSAAEPCCDAPHATRREELCGHLAHRLGLRGSPGFTRLIVEKRATFACVPGLQRPGNATAVPGLYLAGDYTAGDYPATLEGAVRSGVTCARLLMRDRRTREVDER
ncbi:MAG: FAD-dependent oxidoreductase [Betaproteobacteria bacterium]|nr:FAD-dependent oxidoreductase [Betaproteobacteria bacterium]